MEQTLKYLPRKLQVNTMAKMGDQPMLRLTQ